MARKTCREGGAHVWRMSDPMSLQVCETCGIDRATGKPPLPAVGL